MQKTLLVITDGIGYSSKKEGNAFFHARKPTYDTLFTTVPHNYIHTFGLHVGLPEGQMGNSEVGHMSIGAGRILYQDLVKITKALEDNTLITHPLWQTLLTFPRIHLIGLLSDGGVHSHINHIIGLAKLLKKEGKNVIIHGISDGRDVSPSSVKTYIQTLEKEGLYLSTLGGRFFGMDRDNRWDRVKKGYDAIAVALPKTSLSPLEYIENSYQNNVFDEFIEPVAFDHYTGLDNNEAIIFVNFRSDRARELSMALGNNSFEGFERSFKSPYLVTMTQYSKDFSFPVLFPKDNPTNILCEVIAHSGKTQFHTAETEKYAHVTFFFNGGREEPFANETRVLIPSPKVTTYDEQPQMSAYEVTQAVEIAMEQGYDFIVVNYANGDMVGHTGNFDAAVKAVEAVDTCLGNLLSQADKHDYAIVLTSDHGNCEEMCDEEGHVLTNHTVGDVWCFVRAKGVSEVKPGSLSNIAPTILTLLDLPIPKEMDKALITCE